MEALHDDALGKRERVERPELIALKAENELLYAAAQVHIPERLGDERPAALLPHDLALPGSAAQDRHRDTGEPRGHREHSREHFWLRGSAEDALREQTDLRVAERIKLETCLGADLVRGGAALRVEHHEGRG